MRVPVLLAVLCFALSAVADALGFGSLGMGPVETARAQTVPKALEEGGSDAAMKLRKNNWTVGSPAASYQALT
jgi:hypothetical protein